MTHITLVNGLTILELYTGRVTFISILGQPLPKMELT